MTSEKIRSREVSRDARKMLSFAAEYERDYRERMERGENIIMFPERDSKRKIQIERVDSTDIHKIIPDEYGFLMPYTRYSEHNPFKFKISEHKGLEEVLGAMLNGEAIRAANKFRKGSKRTEDDKSIVLGVKRDGKDVYQARGLVLKKQDTSPCDEDNYSLFPTVDLGPFLRGLVYGNRNLGEFLLRLGGYEGQCVEEGKLIPQKAHGLVFDILGGRDGREGAYHYHFYDGEGFGAKFNGVELVYRTRGMVCDISLASPVDQKDRNRDFRLARVYQKLPEER
jgi:hypothetical protein